MSAPRNERDAVRVKVDETTVGTVLRADAGFTCLPYGALAVVASNGKGELYILCADGRHYLDGQLSDCGCYYVGFTRARAALRRADGGEG